MRKDAIGLFWEDRPKVKIKAVPPERTWERRDYLPHFEEAKRFDVPLYTPEDIFTGRLGLEKLVLDTESYLNYWCIAFKGVDTGKVLYYELIGEDSSLYEDDIKNLDWMLRTYATVGFFSSEYDMTVIAMALNRCTAMQINWATHLMINGGYRPKEALKEFKTKSILSKCNHIDLMEVAPLSASLKIYGGRLHTKRMQDLPFKPGIDLTPDQQKVTLWYCVNGDLNKTVDLYKALLPDLTLREEMGMEYRTDFRSRSDAQIAEDIIAKEVSKLNGMRPQYPEVSPGFVYRYTKPDYIRFQTPLLNMVLQTVIDAPFVVSEHGYIQLPKSIEDLQIVIGSTTYNMGIGGLHSCESSASHVADETCSLHDFDVVSYYPRIILNLGLYPPQLGPAFLQVYETIVNQRLLEKARGNKRRADSLKITVNGSFGKLSSPFSILYFPRGLFQTTMTGQLSLFMLIEALELNHIPVVSANTDGIVVKCPKGAEEFMYTVVKWWETVTRFTTEEAQYDALYSRDVNNYIAVKKGKKGVKVKGEFADTGLMKNPTNTICVKAIKELLLNGTPIEQTITTCDDIREFVTVRTVNGGAVKIWDREPVPHSSKEELVKLAGYSQFYGENNWKHETDSDMGITTLDNAYKDALERMGKATRTEYLGKAIRWYYAQGVEGSIIYAKTGNRVPKSDTAKPLMDLPEKFPNDVNFSWYIDETNSMLRDIAFLPPLK